MLTRLFDWLFHRHKWAVLKEGRISDDEGDIIGRWYDLQCEKCGDVKRRNNCA